MHIIVWGPELTNQYCTQVDIWLKGEAEKGPSQL